MKQTKKRTPTKGALIKGYIEMIPSASFELLAEHIDKMLRRKAGIYALYKDDQLYYVGLTMNLKNRLSWHQKDRHAGKWNYFSVYMVERVKFLKDMETLLLHLTKTDGNRAKGKLPSSNSLAYVLRSEATALRKDAQRLEKALKH